MTTPRIPFVWDMETNDPDDFFTLLLLLGHPQVDLRAVTLMPGTPEQVGLVRWALRQFGREDLPVGVYRRDHKHPSVSEWHWKAYGKIPASDEAEDSGPVLARTLGPDATFLVGGPPKNLGVAMANPEFKLGRWFQQGGFAGEGVVPENWQLPKFKGRVTCPSFNPNGAPKEVLAGLSDPRIGDRWFVSKNVCHGVMYDQALHARIEPLIERSLSLRLIHQGMEVYLRKRSEGKAFHDPLAACCAIDTSVAFWALVEIYRSPKGEWGSKLAHTSDQQWQAPDIKANAHITVNYNAENFFRVLTASAE